MSCAMTSHCVHRIGLVREVGVSSRPLGEEVRNCDNAGTVSTRVLGCCHYSMPQGGTDLLFSLSFLCIFNLFPLITQEGTRRMRQGGKEQEKSIIQPPGMIIPQFSQQLGSCGLTVLRTSFLILFRLE